MTEEKRQASEEMRKRIREAVKAGRVGFRCCFCREHIEGEVHALLLISGWNGPEEQQTSQQWFCHAACFTKATGETAQGNP
jgi:hypothetical protein